MVAVVEQLNTEINDMKQEAQDGKPDEIPFVRQYHD